MQAGRVGGCPETGGTKPKLRIAAPFVGKDAALRPVVMLRLVGFCRLLRRGRDFQVQGRDGYA